MNMSVAVAGPFTLPLNHRRPLPEVEQQLELCVPAKFLCGNVLNKLSLDGKIGM